MSLSDIRHHTKDLSFHYDYTELMRDVEAMLSLPIMTDDMEWFLASYQDEVITEYERGSNLLLEPDCIDTV